MRSVKRDQKVSITRGLVMSGLVRMRAQCVSMFAVTSVGHWSIIERVLFIDQSECVVAC